MNQNPYIDKVMSGFLITDFRIERKIDNGYVVNYVSKVDRVTKSESEFAVIFTNEVVCDVEVLEQAIETWNFRNKPYAQ